jgi:hypothetical protein
MRTGRFRRYPWLRPVCAGLISAQLLLACSMVRESNPPRTATEQLLIASAAERAAEQLASQIPKGQRIFVDTTYFEGTDSKYAIGAVRNHLLRSGARLVPDKANSDVVLEVRAGALSMDERQVLVGIPSFDLPIPLAGVLKVPEIALFSKRRREGVAMFAAAAYRPQDGSPAASAEPKLGYAHETGWRVLIFIGWKTRDYLPEGPETIVEPGAVKSESPQGG